MTNLARLITTPQTPAFFDVLNSYTLSSYYPENTISSSVTNEYQIIKNSSETETIHSIEMVKKYYSRSAETHWNTDQIKKIMYEFAIERSNTTKWEISQESEVVKFHLHLLFSKIYGLAASNDKKSAASVLLDRVEQLIKKEEYDQVDEILRRIEFKKAGEIAAISAIKSTYRVKCLKFWGFAKFNAKAALDEAGYNSDKIFFGL